MERYGVKGLKKYSTRKSSLQKQKKINGKSVDSKSSESLLDKKKSSNNVGETMHLQTTRDHSGKSGIARTSSKQQTTNDASRDLLLKN